MQPRNLDHVAEGPQAHVTASCRPPSKSSAAGRHVHEAAKVLAEFLGLGDERGRLLGERAASGARLRLEPARPRFERDSLPSCEVRTESRNPTIPSSNVRRSPIPGAPPGPAPTSRRHTSGGSEGQERLGAQGDAHELPDKLEHLDVLRAAHAALGTYASWFCPRFSTRWGRAPKVGRRNGGPRSSA